MATTPHKPNDPPQRHPAAPPTQRPNQPQGTAQPARPAQHEDASRPKAADVNKGRGLTARRASPPITTPSPRQTKTARALAAINPLILLRRPIRPTPRQSPRNGRNDNPRPPLPKGRDYVAGQP